MYRCMFSPIWGIGNGRGISGFAVNRGAVNRGFTVPTISRLEDKPITGPLNSYFIYFGS